MMITNKEIVVFDPIKVQRGFFIYGKHRSWTEGVNGLVANVTKEEILVQFLPSIRNVTNHYRIRAEEVKQGEWELRISAELREEKDNESSGTDLETPLPE